MLRTCMALVPLQAGVTASQEAGDACLVRKAVITPQLIRSWEAGKTHAELAALEAGITAQLDSGDAGDPEYWAAVLRRLALHKAKARLRELHAGLLERHLQRVVLTGDGVDVAEAMGWEAERQARSARFLLSTTCAASFFLHACNCFHMNMVN